MIGLEKITSKIIADAQADAEKTLEVAASQCAELEAEYKQRAEAQRAVLHEEAEREAGNIISRAKATAAMDKRNIMMTAHSRLVDDAFAQAKADIFAMSDREYVNLLTLLLASAFRDQTDTEQVNRELYGEDDAPETYEMILNDHDRARYGKDVLGGVKNMLAGKVSRAVLDRLTLSERTAPIEGGVILRYGDVEINCSVEMLLGAMRDELEADVCRILFA